MSPFKYDTLDHEYDTESEESDDTLDHLFTASATTSTTINNTATTTTATRAQKRWRVALTAIKISRKSCRRISGKLPSTCTVLDAKPIASHHGGLSLLHGRSAALIKVQKRWRVAYLAIRFCRAMLSVTRGNISKKKRQSQLSGVLGSPSCAVLDIETFTSNLAGDESEPCAEFACIDQTNLTEMVKDRNLIALRRIGGVEGVASNLGTDTENGIHGNEDDVSQRRKIFGSNTYNKLPGKGICQFVKDAARNAFGYITFIISLACAALSIGFDIREHWVKEGWYEGGRLFVYVGAFEGGRLFVYVGAFLIIAFSALCNLRQERQLGKASATSNNIRIDVVRDGRRQQISIFDIVVGDVVILKIGGQIPADGLLLNGYCLRVDESSMTGESDRVEVDCIDNPFLFSGSKVVEGYGRMLVTSVGMNTAWGEKMSSTSLDSSERTSLQARIDKLTSSTGKEKKSWWIRIRPPC